MKLTKKLVCASILCTPLATFTHPFAAESAEGAMEEVVVTSRRKDESIQDVPLSVTAFGEEAIEQLKPQTLRDFDGLAPNVYIGMNTAGPRASAIFIRGIGYSDIEKSQNPQVGVIVDGLQMGSSTGQLVDVFDVESIEINRGPQGVLFGKNTIGGNIVVNRVRPQFNQLNFKVSAEAGNFDATVFKGRVNIPLIDDKLALKLGAIEREREGFYNNITLNRTAGDIDFSSQTLALAWAPTDAFDAVLTYDRINDQSQTLPQDPRFNGDDPFVNEADKVEPSSYDVDQWGLRIDWALGNVTLHSVTGWHDGTDKVNQDFDGADINGASIPFAQLHTLRDQTYELFTQEVRLDGDIRNNLGFMVGFYYSDSDLDFRQDTNNVLQLPAGIPPFTPPFVTDPLSETPCSPLRANATPGLGFLCQFFNARSTQLAGESVESSAYFGSLTYRPGDDLELTLGARYIDEEKKAFNGYTDYSITAGEGLTYDDTSVPGYNEHDFSSYVATPGRSYVTPAESWSETIVTASASYRINQASLVYFSYSEGFRSGGFSIRNASGAENAAYEPEAAEQLEIGIKNDLFDGRLRLNLAWYQLDRDNGQFSSVITLPPGSIPGTTTLINNEGKNEYQGWELESQWIISEKARILFNYGTIDVDNGISYAPCERIDGCVTDMVGVLDPPGTLRQRGGNDDSQQPDKNYSVQFAYDTSIGTGSLGFNIGYKKVGDFLLVNTGGGADQRLFEGGYSSVDARVAYSWALNNGDQLTLTALGKNLTDEEWKEQALFLGGPDTGFQGWGAPRTYAMEIVWSR